MRARDEAGDGGEAGGGGEAGVDEKLSCVFTASNSGSARDLKKSAPFRGWTVVLD